MVQPAGGGNCPAASPRGQPPPAGTMPPGHRQRRASRSVGDTAVAHHGRRPTPARIVPHLRCVTTSRIKNQESRIKNQESRDGAPVGARCASQLGSSRGSTRVDAADAHAAIANWSAAGARGVRHPRRVTCPAASACVRPMGVPSARAGCISVACACGWTACHSICSWARRASSSRECRPTVTS